jgi:hypothetical protein
MISLNEIFYILVIHWVCDFQLQTDKQAKGKSSNLSDLINHTFIYSYSMTLLLMIYNMLLTNINNHDLGLYHISFFFITFLSHTITDYFTSRINKKLWEKGDTHNFFVFVGLDQILHYFQLFLTYKLLF